MKQEITRDVFETSCKIQRMGGGKSGRENFMVYITKIVKDAGWSKGDEIVISCYKLNKGNKEDTTTDIDSEKNSATSASQIVSEDKTIQYDDSLEDNGVVQDPEQQGVTTYQSPGY